MKEEGATRRKEPQGKRKLMNKKRTGRKIVSWSAVPSATLVSSKLIASWEGLPACWEGLRPSWMVLRAGLEGLGAG